MTRIKTNNVFSVVVEAAESRVYPIRLSIHTGDGEGARRTVVGLTTETARAIRAALAGEIARVETERRSE